MLILSRFKDESIRIGDLVRITVVEIVGGKVKLGFEAPTEIPIHREEVWLAINDVLNEQFEEEKP
jgi:carbon storage regulator